MTTLRITALGLALAAALLDPGALAAQEPTGPDTVIYTARRGTITFTHRKHGELAECASCHHESKAEKPYETEYQKCNACHTDPPTAPVTTSLKDAFHDTVGRSGICYDCHKTEAAAGKAAPVACADCHKRDSAAPAPGRRPRP
jgi:hypothetical protein